MGEVARTYWHGGEEPGKAAPRKGAIGVIRRNRAGMCRQAGPPCVLTLASLLAFTQRLQGGFQHCREQRGQGPWRRESKPVKVKPFYEKQRKRDTVRCRPSLLVLCPGPAQDMETCVCACVRLRVGGQ